MMDKISPCHLPAPISIKLFRVVIFIYDLPLENEVDSFTMKQSRNFLPKKSLAFLSINIFYNTVFI